MRLHNAQRERGRDHDRYPVVSLADAEMAADRLLARGVRNVILTRGAQGALVKTQSITEYIDAFDAGPVVDTTGAGDAFNGGFAVALSEGLNVVEATRSAAWWPASPSPGTVRLLRCPSELKWKR